MPGLDAFDEPCTKIPRVYESAQGAHRRTGHDVGQGSHLTRATDVRNEASFCVDELTHVQTSALCAV
jgi:hypothetical protein